MIRNESDNIELRMRLWSGPLSSPWRSNSPAPYRTRRWIRKKPPASPAYSSCVSRATIETASPRRRGTGLDTRTQPHHPALLWCTIFVGMSDLRFIYPQSGQPSQLTAPSASTQTQSNPNRFARGRLHPADEATRIYSLLRLSTPRISHGHYTFFAKS